MSDLTSMQSQAEQATDTPKKSKAAKAAKGIESQEIVITPFKRGRMTVYLLGVTPFVCNRQSKKTRQELLCPSIKQKASARERILKHNPRAEFRSSPYIDDDPNGPTLILMKGGAFKSAACDSAVDVADLKAAQVRRLVQVPDFYVSIYGRPFLWIADVRQQGINKTPDMRTRAIIPEWCAKVTFSYVIPHINEQKLLNLIANGGMTRGVGDGRTEKGALDFGQYTVVSHDDQTVRMIVEAGGRAVQQDALDNPVCYDHETEDLLTWFDEEVMRRESEGNTQVIQSNLSDDTDSTEEEA